MAKASLPAACTSAIRYCACGKGALGAYPYVAKERDVGVQVLMEGSQMQADLDTGL